MLCNMNHTWYLYQSITTAFTKCILHVGSGSSKTYVYRSTLIAQWKKTLLRKAFFV